MKVKLINIAAIQTGLFSKTVKEGEIIYLQSKHFDVTGKLSSVPHPELKADYRTQKHLLRHGDVLFAAKGSKNFAACYEDKNLPAVVSTSFFVIRIGGEFKEKLLPGFLVWSINHPTSQQFLKSRAIGTSMVSISKTALEDLEIAIPELSTQKAILKIAQLRSNEILLNKQIAALREKQIEQQIIEALNK